MNMTSNDEAATRKSKRARADDGSNSGGSAATPTTTTEQSTLAETLGTRLQPMTSLLASQPEELKGYLISSAKDMLAKATTIRQRKQSVKRFTDPWVDPKTNKPHMDETTNQPKSFIPNSLRSKCPVKASPDYKDDTDIMNEVAAAKLEHEKYQKKMTEHAHNLAKLEIKLREQKLQKDFFDHSRKFALCMVINHQIKNGLPAGVKLSREELASKAVYNALKNRIDMINALFEENADALQASFATYTGYDDAAIEEKMDQADKKFLTDHITTNLIAWLPLTSTTLWNLDEKKEMDRKVNSELRKALKPAAIAQATEDVAMAIGDADGANNETMMEVLKKEARAEAKKEMQRSLQKQRKKSSGGDETLEPTPTKPGRNGGGNSNNNSSKKKSKKKKKKDGQKKSGGDRDTPTKPTLKKGNSVRFSKSTTKTRKSGGGGSRGGSNRGGKNKSSARS